MQRNTNVVLLLNVFAGIRIDLRKLDVVLPVFAVVGAPSLKTTIVPCFEFSCVWIELVTPSKYPNSVLLTFAFISVAATCLASHKEFDEL
jgi:hypothetical protein